MKIYYRPTFEIVDIKYELVADGSASILAATNKGNMGGRPDESGAGLGEEGEDDIDAAGYRGLWDNDSGF